MKKKKQVKNKRKMWLWLVMGSVILLAAVITVLVYMRLSANDTYLTDISSITITAEESYEAGEALNTGDVIVTASGVDAQGKRTEVELSNNQYSLLPEQVPEHGHEFEITATLNTDKSIQASADALISREELMRYDVGRTDPDQVQAVLYDNGDLEIVGTGEVKNYNNGEIPWKNDDIMYLTWIDSYAEVESMDYWFSGSEVFRGMMCQVPDTVRSMVQTFYGCTSMQTVPDMTTGVNLEDITGCYSGSGVTAGGTFPGNLKTAENAYKDCMALIHAADASACVRLTNMMNCYSGCSALSDTSTPDCVLRMDGAYQNCLNIKEVTIPSKVETLNSTFSGCTALVTVQGDIPNTCTDLSSTFKDCKFLAGDLRIHCAAQSLSGTFSGAAKNGSGLTVLLSWEGDTAAYQDADNLLQNIMETVETQAKTDGSNIQIQLAE